MASFQDSNILFIVEGELTEPKLLGMIYRQFQVDTKKIYPFKSSIHQLYRELSFDDDLDIVLLLKERTHDQGKKKMLSMKFSAIYLIFDFDPQDPNFDLDKLKDMARFFNDPLDKGLLLINYPMIEAHRHHGNLPDLSFLQKTVTKEQVKKYKQLVGKESKCTDLNNYNRAFTIQQLVHHLVKLNMLITHQCKIPDISDLYSLLKNLDFIGNQYSNYLEDKLYVLSTALFFMIDLKPQSFFEEVKAYESQFK